MRWLAGGAAVLVVLLAWLLWKAPAERTARVPRPASVEAAESPPASADASLDTPPPLTTVIGRVLDEATGEPLPGARVSLHDWPRPLEEYLRETLPPEPYAETLTDAEGRFALERDGTALLRVVAAGFVPAYVAAGPGIVVVHLRAAEERTLRVVDVDGNPIAGATARVYRQGEPWPLALVHADADGRFTVAVGQRTGLVVSAPGYATAEGPFRERIVLRPGAAIAGVVVNAAGAPVADARATLAPPFRPAEVRWTDAYGRFRFEGLDPTTDASLWIAHPAYQEVTDLVVPGSVDLRFVLEPAATRNEPLPLAGVAEGPDGTPLSGATVTAMGGWSTTTDANGRFTVTVASAGTHTVWGQCGHLPALPGERESPSAFRGEVLAQVPGPPVRLRLEAVPRSFAALRFLDAAGRPVSGVTVRPGYVVSGSDAEGRLRLAVELPAGSRAELQAWRSMFQTPFQARTYAEVECEEQVIVLAGQPRAELFVRLPDGSPLPPTLHPEISLYSAQALPIEGTERHDGFAFEFDPKAAPWCRGKLVVTISAPGFLESRPRPPLPEDGGRVEVRLQRGVRISGRLADENGAPLPTGVWIRAIALDGHGATVETGSEFPDGNFELPLVPAGRLRLLAGRHAGVLCWQHALDTVPGQSVDLGTVRLPAPRATTGRVADDRGRPLSGVRIMTVGEMEVATVTNGEGTFTLPLPAWARVRVFARKSGYGTASIPLDQSREIVMPAAGDVLLRIERGDPPDPRIGAWSIHAAPPGADWSWQPEQGERLADDAVRRYVDLPPGPLEFRADTLLGTYRVTVDVIAGRTVEATLRFP